MSDIAPTTFRLPAKDRRLLEAVAHATGQSLSSFLRDAAMIAARGCIAEMGIDEVLRRDKEYLEKQQGKYDSLLEEHASALCEQASSGSNSGASSSQTR